MTKRPLQIALIILGLVPLITGVLGMMGLSDPIYQGIGVPPNALLDSNLRFFAGLWFGLGCAVMWLVPRVESKTAVYRVLWGMIFVGGIGRLLSILYIGLPAAPFTAPFLGFTALEIIGSPLFILWQRRVAQQALA